LNLRRKRFRSGMLPIPRENASMPTTLTGAAIMDALAARTPPGVKLELPPPCLLDMHAEWLEYVEGQRLRMRFPVLPRYRNPLGFMQGGFIAAALDNTVGPFSYLTAPPSVTSQLSLSYLRPVTPELNWLYCTATVIQRTRKTLYLAGEACGDDGKVAAIAQAVCQLL
jgi:acyl-coenzyme A thioesterase PaaI-like protein